MVAEIKAWRSEQGIIYETEEEARRSELKFFITDALVADCGVPRNDAKDFTDILVEKHVEALSTLIVAYKKTLPAYAVAKEDKEK